MIAHKKRRSAIVSASCLSLRTRIHLFGLRRHFWAVGSNRDENVLVRGAVLSTGGRQRASQNEKALVATRATRERCDHVFNSFSPRQLSANELRHKSYQISEIRRKIMVVFMSLLNFQG